MKIKILFLLCVQGLVFVVNVTPPETREIIGSGFFDVNKDRKFLIDENSLIYLDGTLIDYITFEIIGSGYKTAFTVVDDVSVSIDSGTINTIELITNIKGLVTSLSPLKVLEQPVLITSDTMKHNFDSVTIDQQVALSGYLSDNNSLKSHKSNG